MKNPKALRRLRTQCENAKKLLSSALTTTIEVDNVMDDQNLSIEISREKFEELCDDLFKKCISSIDMAIKDAKMTKNQIEEIILIGGSTRIPKIQSMLKEYFDGKNLNRSLNPEESVAIGAAIQGAISDNVKDEKIEKLILLNAIPNSIGIESPGGVMNFLLPKNSTIPCKKTINITTTEDDQNSISIRVFEGENRLAKDNYFIGEFKFEGLPLKPKGQVTIEIAFDYLANFDFNITLVEKMNYKTMTIKNVFEQVVINRKFIDEKILEYQRQWENEQKNENIKIKIEEIFAWIKEHRDASNDEIDVSL